MEQTREEASGALGAPQWPQKPPTGSNPFSNPRHSTNRNGVEPQELHKRGRDDHSQLAVASRRGQTTGSTVSGLDSPGRVTPVSAASHASHASPTFLNSDGAQPRPVLFALPVAARKNGRQHASAFSAPQKASAASSSDTQRPVAPVSAAQPTPVKLNESRSGASNLAADTHSRTLAPQTRHAVAGHSTQTAPPADTLKSLPKLITHAPVVNGSRAGSDSSRQPGSAGDVRGSTVGQSPTGQLSADSPPVSKPILKMKRTGQNYPISSPRSSSPLRTPTSLHQRKTISPNRKTASVPQGGSSLSKAPESPQGRGVGSSTGSNTSAQILTNCKTNALNRQYKSADTRYSKWKFNAWEVGKGIHRQTSNSCRWAIETSVNRD